MAQALRTFLFTDLEGSTRLWEQFPDAMKPALARHDALLRKCVEENNGRIVKMTGDGLHAVFDLAGDAVGAALSAQHTLDAESWGKIGTLSVRMSVHSGEAEARSGDFYGTTVNRAARIMGIGHGGQILLSQAAASLVRDQLPKGASLLDLGDHSLRDLSRPERIFQLNHPDLKNTHPPLKSLSAYKHNLPLQLSHFIGRERELEEVKRMLDETRLLTLLGPGGTGKTRLMLQAAADVVDEFRDGVWLVEFAALMDSDLLVEQLASALIVQETSGRPLLDTIVETLRRKQLLLLFDNVEHLIEESAQLAEQLLQTCPELKIVVTGRESLFIPGERTYQVPSLSLPHSNGDISFDEMQRSEGVQLFLSRASAVRTDFGLTAENASAIVEIVRRLDGIPLALELAAARLQVFSPEQIASRLNNQFRLLTGGRRTALSRQKTLRALIDWSWNLLSEDEKCLLRRLSVFSGGWTLEAAESIAGVDPDTETGATFDVLDALTQLVQKSMVIVDHLNDGLTRYRFLEMIRQYAQEKLCESGETEKIRDRHAEFFTRLVEEASEKMMGRDMLYWIDILHCENENTRAAREWTLKGRLDLSFRIASVNYVSRRYLFTNRESWRWLKQLGEIAMAVPEDERSPEFHQGYANVVIGLGLAYYGLGENAKAREFLTEGLSLGHETNQPESIFFGMNILWLVFVTDGDFEIAMGLAEETLALSKKFKHDFMRVMALGSFTPAFEFQGDHERAEANTLEAIELATQIGNPWLLAMAKNLKGRLEMFRKNWRLAMGNFKEAALLFEAVHDHTFAVICRSEVGHNMRYMGDLKGAEEIYCETIQAFHEIGHLSAVAHQLECFAHIAAGRERFERAAKLIGATDQFRALEGGGEPTPAEVEERTQTLGAIQNAIGPTRFEAAKTVGRTMRIEDAISFALEEMQ